MGFAYVQNTPDVSIQRLGVLGFNEAGDEGAFLLLHFGPSSKAPFVRLIVLKSGAAKPTFEDGGFYMSGGENELADLARLVIDRNTPKLEAMGINLKTQNYDIANYVFNEQKSDKTTGWVDIENVGLTSFSISTTNSPVCKTQKGINVKTCVGNSCVEINSIKIEDCGFESAQLKTIYRTNNSLWLIVVQKIEVMADLYMFTVSPIGIKF